MLGVRLVRGIPLTESATRVAALEGVRGLAMSMVFLVHYSSLFGSYWPGDETAVHLIHRMARAGTDLFLIMSGFGVYAATLRKATPYGEFLKRRVARIYPLFLATLALYLLMHALVPGDSARIPDCWWRAAAYVAANAALVPLAFGVRPLITVSWTLGYIVLFYATLPAAARVLGLRGWNPATRRKAVAGAACVWFGASVLLANPHARAGMFLIGMLVYECRAEGGRRIGKGRECALVAFATAGVLCAGAAQWCAERLYPEWSPEFVAAWRTALLGGPLFLLSLVAFSSEGWVSRLCSAKPLRRLGAMSYSYYLMHGLILSCCAAGARLLVGGGESVWLFAMTLAPAYLLTVEVSAAVFAGVERPLAERFKAGQSRAVVVRRALM